MKNSIITTFSNAITSLAAAIKGAFSSPHPAASLPLGPATTPFTNAVLLHLCSDNREVALHVLRWLAEPLRKPGTKMPNALAVCGGPGIGKSLFFTDLVASMYTQHAKISNRELSGEFNAWALNQQFAVVDDFDGNRENSARIKHLLTSDHILIKRKSKEPTLQKNRMNFVFLSGDMNAIPVASDDRRFFVVEAPTKPLPHEFYAGMAREIREGGAQAYLQFLIEQLDAEPGTKHLVRRAA